VQTQKKTGFVKTIERLPGAERNLAHYPKLLEAAAFIEQSFEAVGCRLVRQEYEAQGQRFANLEVELLGQIARRRSSLSVPTTIPSAAHRGPTIMPQALQH